MAEPHIRIEHSLCGRTRTCSCPECSHKCPSGPQLAASTSLRDDGAGSEKRKQPESTRAPKRPARRGPVCGRHRSPLDIYCCTDEQIICAVCASREHSGHTFGSVSEERRRKQEELENTQAKSKQVLQKQEKKLKNLEKTLEQIQEEARETQDYCESILAGVIDSIQRHYMSVRRLIRGQQEEAVAQVEKCLQTLQGKMEGMRKREAELDHLAQTDNDVLFLQSWQSLRHLCEKDHLHPPREEDPLLHFELTRRAVDQLGRQLEEFCDKEFASLAQTANEGEQQGSGSETMPQRREARSAQCHGLFGVKVMTNVAVEPKTRAEFLQYACDLSLDPTTAHEDLTISAGDKEVRQIPFRWRGPTVRHPQRFIHRRQVLCREGLQAERCYYEVEVEGDKAEIALAYKAMDRKSRTRLSAFGGNANSWSLDRSANYSVSHDADSVQLTTHPSQSRVGIYLKFKEGTLSFYEVSDSMTFLYKVEAEFTEPLYPGFWIGEKCCIRICDLKRDTL